jgi:hypothetical protein
LFTAKNEDDNVVVFKERFLTSGKLFFTRERIQQGDRYANVPHLGNCLLFLKLQANLKCSDDPFPQTQLCIKFGKYYTQIGLHFGRVFSQKRLVALAFAC